MCHSKGSKMIFYIHLNENSHHEAKNHNKMSKKYISAYHVKAHTHKVLTLHKITCNRDEVDDFRHAEHKSAAASRELQKKSITQM